MIRTQVKEFFITDTDARLNKFLSELLPSDIIDIKYSTGISKVWDEDNNEDSEFISSCLVIFKTLLPEKQSNESVSDVSKP